MRNVFTLALACVLMVTPAPALAAQQPVSVDVETAAMRQVAGTIPLGSQVKIQMRSGRRLTATLLAVDADAIVVKRNTRIPEPAVTIPFSDLARLQRDQKSGFTVAKAIGVGLAAGVGAILTIFAIAVSLD